jgi:glycosyltransferase involved in cell wall biosynthesis
MACGLPVIGPAAGGVGELVEHGQSGLLVPPNDAEALAEAICQLVDDPTLRKQMGARAHQKIQAHTWENGARHMLNLWEELIRR